MTLKIAGALCVIAGCGGCGFLMASQYRKRIRIMRELLAVLEFMMCELQYRATPLPQLCSLAARHSNGIIQRVFLNLTEELEAQISPDAGMCMVAALSRTGEMDKIFTEAFTELGHHLGKFDLPGQLRGLEQAQKTVQTKLDHLTQNKDSRIRSYQTLGLCAGAAMAILFV